MADTKWTPDQQAAIEVRGRAAFVAAAAGSGKTAVLVEKLIRLLSDPNSGVTADNIIVATFTNDAAAQMKSKISKKLSEMLDRKNDELAEAEEGDRQAIGDVIAHLSEQLSLLPSANISTIHSFCFRLIRENADAAGVDPSFAVIDADSEVTVVNTAVKNAVKKRLETHGEELTELYEFFTPNAKDFGGLIEIISKLREKILALPFPTLQMEKFSAAYAGKSCLDDKGNIISEGLIELYLKDVRETMQNVLDTIGICRSVLAKVFGGKNLENKEKEAYDAYVTELDAAQAIAEELEKNPENIFDREYSVDLTSPDLAKNHSFGKNSFTDNNAEFAAGPILRDLRANYRSSLQKYVSTSSEYRGKVKTEPASGAFLKNDVIKDFEIHAHICGLVFGLLTDALSEERRLKIERKCLGFSDAEQIAAELLCDRDDKGNIVQSDLARSVAEQSSIVMLDEFQDSTAIQELIFRMLSKGGTADMPGTDFFAVGDIKQSIYRFRSSDPSLFAHDLDLCEDYASDSQSVKPAKILLKQNFRSAKGVVDYVNAFFDAVMSEKYGGVDYNADHILVQGRKFDTEPENTAFININEDFIKKCKAELGSKSATITEGDKTAAEAEAAALEIKRLLELADDKGNKLYKPSDFCILGRYTSDFALYAETLEKYGIAAEHPAPDDLLGTPEISMMMNILKAADNPYLDSELASALMSPVFMFGAEEMARIRLMGVADIPQDSTAPADDNAADGKKSKKISGSKLYRNMVLASKADAHGLDKITAGGRVFLTRELVEKCADFCGKLERIRSFRLTHTVCETVRFIYDMLDIMQIMAILPDGASKRANLRLFLRIAEDFDRSECGLGGFIRHCGRMADNKVKIKSAAASSSGCVTVKTIHKSKGLQYPFVFLLGTGSKFKSFAEVISFNSRLGIAFASAEKLVGVVKSDSGDVSLSPASARYRSLPEYVLRSVNKRSELDEEMMLLYVALTRAECRLFIPKMCTSDDDSRREVIRIMMGLDAINGGAPCMAVSGKFDFAMTGVGSLSDIMDIADISAEHNGYVPVKIDSNDFSPKNVSAAVRNPAQPVKELEEKIEALMKDDYSYDRSRTAAKLTVSEIAKEHDDTDVSVFVKKAAKTPKGMTGALRGTAVHAFMELADFDKLKNGRDNIDTVIADEAARLVKDGLMEQAQADCVDNKMITDFADNALFSRMTNDKTKKIYRERNFLVKISDLGLDDTDLSVYNNTEGMLQGTADLLFEEEDGYVLVDYKTDRVDSAAVLLDRYTRQLSLYARVFSLILDKPVKEAYIYSFTMGKEIAVEI